MTALFLWRSFLIEGRLWISRLGRIWMHYRSQRDFLRTGHLWRDSAWRLACDGICFYGGISSLTRSPMNGSSSWMSFLIEGCLWLDRFWRDFPFFKRCPLGLGRVIYEGISARRLAYDCLWRNFFTTRVAIAWISFMKEFPDWRLPVNGSPLTWFSPCGEISSGRVTYEWISAWRLAYDGPLLWRSFLIEGCLWMDRLWRDFPL